MRIGIDVRYLSHRLVGGVHTYVRHFVPALVPFTTGDELVLYADRKRPFELADLPSHVTVQYLPWHHGGSSVLNDTLRLRRAMERDRIEVAHFPANYGFGPRSAKLVVTLHDAINLMPLRHVLQSKGTIWTARTRAMAIYLHICSRIALRRADLVVTVSEHARSEIVHYGHYPAERIVPVHHAPTPDLRCVEDKAVLATIRARYGLEQPFILADGLKNPEVIMRAWEQLPGELSERYTIVFFSRREPVASISRAEAAGNCRVLRGIPRADLVVLYSSASAFVFPSWIEGFGIPILEAMTCGAPVICADNSAMPEVAGGAALLCGAEDDGALAKHLARVLGDTSVAQQLRQLGFARAAQFSWSKTARQLYEVYARAATLGPARETLARHEQVRRG